MHARVATFEAENAAVLDQMTQEIREDVESGKRPPGLEHAKGVMILVDRKSSKMMGITFFDDEEGLKRGDEALNAMSPGGGTRRSSVEFYEVPIERMD